MFTFQSRLHPYEDRQDNAYLRAAIRMFEGEFVGPEAFAIDVDGNIYTGLVDGRIIRFNDTSYTTIIRMGSPPYDKCGGFGLMIVTWFQK